MPASRLRRVALAATVTGLLAVPALDAAATPAALTPVAHLRLDATVGLLTTTVDVAVTDLAGHPVGGVPVTITRTTADGTTPVATVRTDAAGVAAASEPVGLIGPAATYRARLADGTMALETVERPLDLDLTVPAPPDLAPLGDRTTIIDGFVDMVVDDAHRRLFVSTDSALLVFDADGTRIGTVPGAEHARHLVLSQDDTTLFTIVGAEPAITVVDTATMKEVGTLPLPDAGGWIVRADTLERAADRLVTYFRPTDVTDETAILGVVPLGNPAGGATSRHYAGDVSWRDTIAADPRRPQVVLVGSGSPASAARWDVTGVPTATTSTSGTTPFPVGESASNVAGVRFSQDGTDLYVASGSPYHADRLDPETWSVRSTYPIGAYPAALAPTRDGQWIAVERFGYGAVAGVWDRAGLDQITAIAETPRGIFNDPEHGILDFSADGSRLYSVLADGHSRGGAPYTQALQVWANPLAACSLRLTPTLASDGTHLTVTGTLTSAAPGTEGSVGGGASEPTGAPIADAPVALVVSGAGLIATPLTSETGELSTAVTLPAAAPAVTVTASVQLPGAPEPCRIRAEAVRPAAPPPTTTTTTAPPTPTLRPPGAPNVIAALGLRGGIVTWWLPPASTGGRPVVAYSMLVFDAQGRVVAWVNAGSTAFVTAAALAPGRYTVRLYAWSTLGLGDPAVSTTLTVT